jgi:hypothetical protein
MNRRSLMAIVAIAVALALAPACRKVGKLALQTETRAAEYAVASEIRTAYRVESALEAEVRAGYAVQSAVIASHVGAQAAHDGHLLLLREISGQTEAATDLHRANSASSVGHGVARHDGISGALVEVHVANDAIKAVKEEQERKRKFEDLIAQGDEAAARGEIDVAAKKYSEANATGIADHSEAPDTIGRGIIRDLANGKTSDVVADLARLSASPLDLSPAVRKGMLDAVRKRSSEAAFQHVERTLGTTAVTANQHFTLVSLDNTLVTMRDVSVDQRHASLPWGVDLSLYTVVIDDRLRTGHDGMLHHLGGNAARWRKPKNVRIELLEQIDQLPDVLHETTTGVFARPLRRAKWVKIVVGAVVLVRLCDHGDQTNNPRDAC